MWEGDWTNANQVIWLPKVNRMWDSKAVQPFGFLNNFCFVWFPLLSFPIYFHRLLFTSFRFHSCCFTSVPSILLTFISIHVLSLSWKRPESQSNQTFFLFEPKSRLVKGDPSKTPKKWMGNINIYSYIFISYVFPVRFLHKLLASFHFLSFLIHLIWLPLISYSFLVILFIPLRLKDPPLPKFVLANSYTFQFSGQKSSERATMGGWISKENKHKTLPFTILYAPEGSETLVKR